MKTFKNLLKRPNNNLPQVLSISFGDDEDSRKKKLSRRLCKKFMQFGLRGRSVLVAAGDFGLGKKCDEHAKGDELLRYVPDIFGSYPWATIVGGTYWNGTGEGAWDSGGAGFSNYHPRPGYQADVVDAYLQGPGLVDATNNAGYFNAQGRAYPDVAAMAVGVRTINFGKQDIGDGTSYACPIFASIIALLNGVRLNDGKGPLGFLNPWLYGVVAPGGGFNEVDAGRVLGCRALLGKTGGFNASTGWDAATGLGTPNFEVMKSLMP
ncbi:hypothetical protein H072_2349 [Dactylellina haptotyla CBS 200.50]|uniref:Peptidase S53 domain-containing protein n=1 Tax=Dactylellina haptotyla (strain CBS 200.50) TaxID=1284197 RepID=S8AR68_DACHA|nr:hypothetical protein H072_2349 [Dactylellina haptotyla CBS 200.50]